MEAQNEPNLEPANENVGEAPGQTENAVMQEEEQKPSTQPAEPEPERIIEPEQEVSSNKPNACSLRLLPNEGQQVGPTGATIPQDISNQIIKTVKSGDIEKFMHEKRMYGIEVRDVVAEPTEFFCQNLIFAAVAIPDEDKAIQMITILVQLGVDIFQKDNLKQTPLFYAARDGKVRVLQLLIENGMQVNDFDTYGQNPIYYAVNLGQLDACKLLH